jgi:predicted nucleic acid-binding protein
VILVDSPLWSLALRRRPQDLSDVELAHVREMDRLVRSGEITLIGAIRQEVLSGIRDEIAWARLRNALRPFTDLPVTRADYERAAQFFDRCQSAGMAGSATDLLICSASVAFSAPIYSTDADFLRYARILGLELHAVQTDEDGS